MQRQEECASANIQLTGERPQTTKNAIFGRLTLILSSTTGNSLSKKVKQTYPVGLTTAYVGRTSSSRVVTPSVPSAVVPPSPEQSGLNEVKYGGYVSSEESESDFEDGRYQDGRKTAEVCLSTFKLSTNPLNPFERVSSKLN